MKRPPRYERYEPQSTATKFNRHLFWTKNLFHFENVIVNYVYNVGRRMFGGIGPYAA